MNYVYIIECNDGTLYTGWTTDIEKRMSQHNQGKAAKYTRGRYPVELKYYEEFAVKEEALKRDKRRETFLFYSLACNTEEKTNIICTRCSVSKQSFFIEGA